MSKFNHLNIPPGWQHYWTRHPQGYSILEALLNWVAQVDNMVDNQNELNNKVDVFSNELDSFLERFDPRLQEEVTKILSEWQESGFLDIVLDQAFQTQIDEVSTQLTQTTVNVASYQSLVVNDDWTEAIQAAVDVDSDRVVFPKNREIKTKRVVLTRNQKIDLNGSKLIGLEEAIFCVATPLDYIEITNCGGVTFSSVGATSYSHFFANYARDGILAGVGEGFPQGDTLEQYSVKDLRIHHNQLGYSKVAILGDDTLPKVHDNVWEHEGTVHAAPYYLYLYKGHQGRYPIFKDIGWIENNVFKVHTPDGPNKDIVKITSGVRGVIIEGNHFENRNPLSAAQVDVFTGAHKMRFMHNTLINVQLHRKQEVGNSAFGEAPHEYGYDLIFGNSALIEEGHRQTIPFYLMGSLFSVAYNQIEIKSTVADRQKVAFDLIFSASDVGIFNTTQPLGFMITNNIVNFQGSGGEQYFINSTLGRDASDKLIASKFGIISQNIVIGGTRLLVGAVEKSVVSNNIWLDNADGAGFSGALDSVIATGNVSENPSMGIDGITKGNATQSRLRSVSVGADGVIDVSNGSVFTVSTSLSSALVTSITGGFIGQEITLVFPSTTVSVDNSNAILLHGSADFVPGNNKSTLTLLKDSITSWVEIGRSNR